jgi:hypothetical protein
MFRLQTLIGSCPTALRFALIGRPTSSGSKNLNCAVAIQEIPTVLLPTAVPGQASVGRLLQRCNRGRRGLSLKLHCLWLMQTIMQR